MKNFLTVILFATIIFFAGCSNEPTVEVTAEKVQTLEGNISLTRDGKILLSDAIPLHAKISGTVLAIYFTDGGDVTEGQPLFKIGNQKDEAELLQKKTELAAMMTALPKLLAEKNPDAAQTQAEIAELQELVKQTEENSAAGIVTSPKTGAISLKHAQTGESVLADETLLAFIGSKNPVNIKFDVSEAEKNLLAADGLKVSLKLGDGTTYPLAGKISFSEPGTADATFDNPDGLLTLGSDVKIQIDGIKISKTLLIPESAVFPRGEENFVFVVASDKTAVEKKISLGGKLNDKIIVTDGLKADDSVVVEDLTNLREGTPLSVKTNK